MCYPRAIHVSASSAHGTTREVSCTPPAGRRFRSAPKKGAAAAPQVWPLPHWRCIGHQARDQEANLSSISCVKLGCSDCRAAAKCFARTSVAPCSEILGERLHKLFGQRGRKSRDDGNEAMMQQAGCICVATGRQHASSVAALRRGVIMHIQERRQSRCHKWTHLNVFPQRRQGCFPAHALQLGAWAGKRTD